MTPPLDPVHIQFILKRDTLVWGLVVSDTRVVQMQLVTFHRFCSTIVSSKEQKLKTWQQLHYQNDTNP